MLKLVSTPIGNLGDFSLRAAQALCEADIIACEDTRTTKKLVTLCSLQIRAKLLAYHDHNGHEMRPKLLSYMKSGKQIVLVTMPARRLSLTQAISWSLPVMSRIFL